MEPILPLIEQLSEQDASTEGACCILGCLTGCVRWCGLPVRRWRGRLRMFWRGGLRALFLDARAAIEAAPRVADVLARELGRSEAWKARDLESFYAVARGYVYEGE